MTIGMKVVCVNDDFPKPLLKLYEELPKKNEVYTVRVIYHGRDRLHPTDKFEYMAAFLLEELHNPEDPKKKGAELGFKASRFRPVETLQVDEPITEDSPRCEAGLS
jgi:hypothetical protein